MSEQRSHVAHGDLYLYRDAVAAWGHPDVLTDGAGGVFFLSAEAADTLAEAFEMARAFEACVPIIQDLRQKIEEGTPGVMHKVDKAFYDLTIKERDFAWRESEALREKVTRLEEENEELRRLWGESR